MRNNLERFVRDNRNEFDSDAPSDALWERIKKDLPANDSGIVKENAPVRSIKWKWISVAAAAVLLIVAGAVYVTINTGKPEQGLAKNDKSNSGGRDTEHSWDIASIDPDYAKQVAQFTTVIDQKQLELQTLQKDDPGLYRQFSNDIAKLDSTYGLLKKQLPVNPNKEELLQAMIYNLQLQVDLLNQQLTIIQKIKSVNSKSL